MSSDTTVESSEQGLAEVVEGAVKESDGGYEDGDDMMSRIRYWLRQESDHQWLSMGAFIAVVVVVAMLIQQSATMPGLSSSSLVDSNNRILDIAWDEEGTMAVMVVDTPEGTAVQKWVAGKVTDLTFDSPRSVERITDGWLVTGDDGKIARCQGPCDILGILILDWQNSSANGLRVVDISSEDGVSGYMLIQSFQLSSSDANGSVGDRGGEWLSSVRYFDNDIVSPATFFDEGQQMSTISTTSSGALSAGFGWFGLNSVSNNARGVICSISGVSSSLAPDITLRHIGEREYHTIVARQNDSGSTVVGLADVINIDAEDNLNIVSGTTGAATAALDGDDNVWLAGDFSSGQMEMISSGSNEAETVKVMTLDGFAADVGTTRGDVIEFHGLDDSGSTGAQYDPAEASSLYSLDYLIRMVFIFGSCTIFVVMMWSIREKIQLS
jgi:hypothetical protein